MLHYAPFTPVSRLSDRIMGAMVWNTRVCLYYLFIPIFAFAG